LQKADSYNNSHTSTVANVYQHGGTYTVVISELTYNTADVESNVKTKLECWNIYKQVFNGIGIDIDALPDLVKQIYFNSYNTSLYSSL